MQYVIFDQTAWKIVFFTLLSLKLNYVQLFDDQIFSYHNLWTVNPLPTNHTHINNVNKIAHTQI